MKQFTLLLLGVLFFVFGCKKEEVVNIQQANSKKATATAEIEPSHQLMTSTNVVTEKFKHTSLVLIPTSYTNEYTVNVGFEYEGIVPVLATVKLEGGSSTSPLESIVYIQPGSNLINFYSFSANTNGTISAMIQLSGSGTFSTLASVEAYFPVYDPVLNIQGLPENVSYYVTRTIYETGGFTDVSVHFFWDERYRTSDKLYSFDFFLNYGSGIYLSGSAYPSQGSLTLSATVPGNFNSTFFNYKIAVYESINYYYIGEYFNRPSSSLNYNPFASDRQTKVLRLMGAGLY